jgi:poly-gamma-glutamate synthase PgsB/CapB
VPRIILEDGSEIPVRRRGRATIREQMRVIALAARQQADAVVLECMAIHPELQRISEEAIVRSTVGAITNVRRDHTEVMGEARDAVARCLARTVPRGGVLVSADREHAAFLARVAAERGTRFIPAFTAADAADEGEGELLAFPENEAVALAVCEAIGVDRACARLGMRGAAPDVGALRIQRIRLGEKAVLFVNAFSLNDVDSLGLAWGRLDRAGRLLRPLTAILNCRADRPTRSRAFGEYLVGRLAVDRLVLVGEATRHAYRAALHAGLDPDRILTWEGRLPATMMDELADRLEEDSGLIGAGNFYGAGEALAAQLARSALHVP